MSEIIQGVEVLNLNKISVEGGNIFHILKSSDKNFFSFGEAYFSEIDNQYIKGWKMHTRMYMNLTVAYGAVKFVLYDDRPKSRTFMNFNEFILDRSENYKRLTISPGIWFAFQGIKNFSTSIVLNVGNIEHDQDEQKKIDLRKINYKWDSI